MLQKLTDFFAVYRDRKMLAMLALGFASGFPFPLVFNTLSLWLKFDNLSLEIIGIFPFQNCHTVLNGYGRR